MPTDTIQLRPRKERKENADRRRRQLLDATRRSIVNNGLRRTTLATVAAEAGLSPGVAVFYFQTKSALLTEALRDLYATYERNWNRLLAAAGDHPIDKLVALIDAEFDPKVCNNEFISVWFAFWGEKELVVAQGDELTAFDKRVEKVGLKILEELLPGNQSVRRTYQAGLKQCWLASGCCCIRTRTAIQAVRGTWCCNFSPHKSLSTVMPF